MNWQPYLKASWELVMESEGKSQVFLDQELEAYLVHMMARNFRKTQFPPISSASNSHEPKRRMTTVISATAAYSWMRGM